MAKKITKDQLKTYIANLTVWQMVEIEGYIQDLKDKCKNMPDENLSNPPGVPPPPPKH